MKMHIVIKLSLLGFLMVSLPSRDAVAQALPRQASPASTRAAQKEKIRQANIKSVTVWRYTVGPSGAEQAGEQLSYAAYDRHGNTLEQHRSIQTKGASEGLTHRYDGRGRIVESRATRPHAALSRITYTYTGTDQPAKVVSYAADGSIRTTVAYTYDGRGNPVAMHLASPDGRIDHRTTYAYDSRGNLTEVTLHVSNTVQASVTSAYNGADKLIEQVRYDASGSVVRRTEFAYNGTGQMTRMAAFDAEGRLVSESSYRHDGRGNKVEAVASYPSADLSTRATFAYDANGNMLEQVKYNTLGEPVEVIRHVYAYHNS